MTDEHTTHAKGRFVKSINAWGYRGLGAAGVLTAILVTAPVPLAAAERQSSQKRAASQLKLSQNLYMAGRYGEALGSVEKALKDDAKFVQAHQLKGQILVSMDLLDEAIKEFDRTLQLQPDYTDARNWKGYALVQLKRYDEAMKEYDRALQDKTFATPEVIHLNIGKLYRLRGDNENAIASMKKSVELNPSFARGYFELGMTYEQMGRNEDSLRSYTDALVGMEESPDLNLRLGMALMKKGDNARAKERFEKVIRLAPDGPEAVKAREQIGHIQTPS